LHRAAPHFSWRIPRKFWNHFATAPAELTPLLATMYAEVIRLGGTTTEFRRLSRHHAFCVDRTEKTDRPSYDEFWAETVQWLAEHRNEITDVESDQILDWAMHEHTETEDTPAQFLDDLADDPARRIGGRFSWKGRSVEAVMRRSQEYLQSSNRPVVQYRWNAHGWDTSYEFDGKQWDFVELTSGMELYKEGKALHHCVASYAGRCAAGYSAIVSVRSNGERCLTVELAPAMLQVIQARGLQNLAVTSRVLAALGLWLRTKVVRCDAGNSE
jgi:hypothetical protein